MIGLEHLQLAVGPELVLQKARGLGTELHVALAEVGHEARHQDAAEAGDVDLGLDGRLHRHLDDGGTAPNPQERRERDAREWVEAPGPEWARLSVSSCH